MQILYAKSINGQLQFDNQKESQEYLRTVEGKKLIVQIKRETGVRSDRQNNSLHLWLDLLARELNDAGYTVQKFLKQAIELNWTGSLCKELIWRPVQEAILGKRSTTQLAKVQDIDEVFDHLNRHLGERFQIHVEWPHEINKDNAPIYESRK